MGQTLEQIAGQLKESNKKVQLIYAFNGTGKTRLSCEFKNLIESELEAAEDQEEQQRKFLYYNAFTEDLFYWDNDLDDPKLQIQPNDFISWILEEGYDGDIIHNFEKFSGSRIKPVFDAANNTISFGTSVVSQMRGEEGELIYNDDESPLMVESSKNIKISKGEESNFIWSIFYTLLEKLIFRLNNPEEDDPQFLFNQLEYVFIDDPVSSLDENHLIELAVKLASLIKSTKPEVNLKFILTTHSPLFYNVLFNELKNKECYFMQVNEDRSFTLTQAFSDSDKRFSYHLYLKKNLEQAVAEDKVEKYHFMLMRNLYEKTASFLGYPSWSDLLKTLQSEEEATLLKRKMHFNSHSSLSTEEVQEPDDNAKQNIVTLLDNLKDHYSY